MVVNFAQNSWWNFSWFFIQKKNWIIINESFVVRNDRVKKISCEASKCIFIAKPQLDVFVFKNVIVFVWKMQISITHWGLRLSDRLDAIACNLQTNHSHKPISKLQWKSCVMRVEWNQLNEWIHIFNEAQILSSNLARAHRRTVFFFFHFDILFSSFHT